MSRSPLRRPKLGLEEYERGVLAGDRAILARAITLVESSSEVHRRQGQELLARLLPHTGKAQRVGISGVPGAGKSTFIEAFGSFLTAKGYQVAVLAIDPSSTVTGGSILGDKTRMQRLASDPAAFIRPSPSGGSLGGVASKTREASLLCEAAGFDVILIETVGVGQSEVSVADMVDFYLVLMIAGAGDDLQGIKKGILELADLIVVNKADGDNLQHARVAAREYVSALRYLGTSRSSWQTTVQTCSALEGTGLDAIWQRIQEHRELLGASGELAKKRQSQLLAWMWGMVEEGLRQALRQAPGMRVCIEEQEAAVLGAQRTPSQSAQAILDAFLGDTWRHQP